MNGQEATIKTIGKYSYYMQKCLGEGSFGKVFQGFENSTKEKVAIKKVDFKTIQKDSYLQKAIHDEIKILNKFKHENIVQLHEVLNSKKSLYIIMEYCRDGDLKKYLRSRKRLTDKQSYQVMRQVLKGYQQLAKQNTIHRDLKPANILIDSGLFKICDFGFSKVIKDPNTALKTCVGSPIYMAPQILQKKDYSAKCDIWSLGIIYYQLINGTVPWTARSQRELLQNIKRIPVKFQSGADVSSKTEKIIKKMLEVRQQNRASLKDLQRFFQIDVQSYTSSPLIQQHSPNFQKSYTTINTRVLNRHYFEELSWRYFVCIQLKPRLSLLNNYNFTKNNFQRLIVLIISSILSNFARRQEQIQKIHESDTVEMVMKEYQFYQSFQAEFFKQLTINYSTRDILKEFQYTDLAHRNFNEQVIKKSQRMLIKIAQSLLKQLQAELKILQQKQQKKLLLYVTQLLVDMLIINERQAKTGMGDVSKCLQDRSMASIEKRLSAKFAVAAGVARTQFF